MGANGDAMETFQHPSIFSRDEWTTICGELKFSARQAEIAAFLLEGWKIMAVAQHLGISPDTVRAHLRRLYPKLDVSDRLGLMTRCVQTFRQLYAPHGCSPIR